MKTTYPAAQSTTPEARPQRLEWPIVRRIVLTAVLVGTLAAAIHWAMNVTNANARQVSHNLTNMQDRFGKQDSPRQNPGSGKSSLLETAPGPVLEPASEGR
jgi:hypothetical protein